MDRQNSSRGLVESSEALEVGEVVDARFRVLGLAGAGGMGDVYRVEDLRNGERLALKTVRSTAPRRLERFGREVRALAQLRHPAIVRYVAHGPHRCGHFLAMEWLDGIDLATRLDAGPLGIVDTLQIARQTAAALAVSHRRAIIHRDIKPANLFLVGRECGAVKVLDFGVALLADERARLTRTGEVLGTPGYMAPEQWRLDGDVDGRADVFALGIVVYQCLTGAAAPSPHAIATEPERLARTLPGVPTSLQELLARMLSADRAQRPADGAELLAELLALEAEKPLTATALTVAEHRVAAVVLVGMPAEDDVVTQAPSSPPSPVSLIRDRSIVRSVVTAFGGRIEPGGGGSLRICIAGHHVAVDQAVEAVRCALALRRLLRDVPIAVISGRAASSPADFTRADVRLGDVPVVAVDEVTAGLLPRRFETIGGTHGLVVAGELERDDGARLLLGSPAPFVGRDLELDTLRATFDACVEDRVTRAVLVSGAAGVGKSRLRHELVDALDRRGRNFQLWLGRGDPMRSGSPYALLADAVRNAVGVVAGEPIAVTLDKLTVRVAQHVDASDIERVAGFLGEMIGAPPPDDRCDDIAIARRDAGAMAEGFRRAWCEWVAAEAATAPILLVLEDLHWGDAASIRLAEAIVREDQPAMLLGLTRPDVRETFPALFGTVGAHELHLARLSRRHSAALVDAVLGDRVAPDERDQLVDQAAGHPLYLEELIRYAAEGRRHGVPDTVRAMVQARLEDLDPDARRVLRAASILGETFWTGGVAALLGSEVGAAPVSTWLDAIAEREIIERRPSTRVRDEIEWTFRHALVRDGAYEMLTDDDRVLGHRLAGSWLESMSAASPAVLAEHFERGEAWERALTHLERATQHAIGAEAMEEAERYFARAMALHERLPSSPALGRRRVALVLDQLPAVLTLIKFPSYHALLIEHEGLAEALKEPALLGALHGRVGESLWALGRFDEALERLDRAIPLCEAANAHEEAAYSYQSWMFCHVFRGTCARALTAYPALAEHMRCAPHPRWHTYGLGALTMANVGLGRWSEALAAADEGVRIADASRQPGVRSFAWWVRSHAQTYGGNFDEAVTSAQRAIEVAVTIGDRTWAECALAAARCRAGDPAATVAVLAEAVQAMRAAKFAAGEMYAHALVESLVAIGRRDDARAAARDMLEVATTHRMVRNIGLAHGWLAELASSPAEAATHASARDAALAMTSG